MQKKINKRTILPRKTPTQEKIQGTVGQQGPRSKLIAKLPLAYKTALNKEKKTPYGEKQTSKETK